MGLFWDLIQQSQISGHADRAASDSARITRLEQEVARQAALIRELVLRLERKFDTDLNQDDQIG